MLEATMFSTRQIGDVQKALDLGEPYVHKPRDTTILDRLRNQAAHQSVIAHSHLYSASPERRAVFGKNPGETQYVSWAMDDKPCFAQVDPTKPNTDVGIRGVNLDVARGETNPTTVIHTTDQVSRYNALGELSLSVAMDRLFELADYTREYAIEPYLKAVAEIHGIDPVEYHRHFFNPEKDWSSVMRSIMYHAGASVGSSADGSELMIKEHADQSGFTADIYTLGRGLLEYLTKDGTWCSIQPTDGIPIFPSAGDQHLNSPIPPLIHRVVGIEDQNTSATLEGYQRDYGLVVPHIWRLALPFFISSQRPDAEKVQPHSPTTHPTYSAQLTMPMATTLRPQNNRSSSSSRALTALLA